MSNPPLGVKLNLPLFPLSFKSAPREGNTAFCTSAIFHEQNIHIDGSFLPSWDHLGSHLYVDNVLFASSFIVLHLQLVLRLSVCDNLHMLDMYFVSSFGCAYF